jgi:hypothetical protein
MTCQFKVWKLKLETHVSRYKPEKIYETRLVLRDKNGRIRKVAHNENEAHTLQQWYEKYNREERLDTLLKTREIKKAVRKIKAKTRKRGFKYQLCIYGIYKNPKNGNREYRRYEIFKATPFTNWDGAKLTTFFKRNIPKSPAGVYIWHNQKLYVNRDDSTTRGTMPEQTRIDQD